MEVVTDDIQQPIMKAVDSIKVLVRVRPFSDKEISENNDSTVEIQDDKSLKVTSVDGKKSFQCEFDSVLGQGTTQAQVYDTVRSCTRSVLDGFNSTIFAYGQTGSGKTYSMYGPPTTTIGGRGTTREADFLGLIPRAVNEIFEVSRSKDMIDFKVYCSFVQIYNENLFDMLRDSSMVSPLSIREDKKEIYVQGLSEYHVQNVADTLQLLKIAEENRAIRETHMNQFSSRSHSIFQIYVEQKRVAEDGGEISYRAKFNLVDLAGSEKWNTKTHMREAHIAEMTNINLSLHTLGKCISALAQISILKEKEAVARDKDAMRPQNSLLEKSNSFLSAPLSGSATPNKNNNSHTRPSTVSSSANIHVPYRDSKLTRLLQDSLGGNAKTFLIATISPARANCEESISTLKFADRAKQVMVSATVNETRPVDHALVKRLQQEVESLKVALKRLIEQNNLNATNSTSAGGVVGGVNQALQGINLSASYSNLFSTISPANTVSKLNSAVSGSRDDLSALVSLEKALNKEQTQSQHLATKNETLIRELEELKSSHDHVLRHNQELIHTVNALSHSATQNNYSNNNGNNSSNNSTLAAGGQIGSSEAAQLVESCSTIKAQSDALWDVLDNVQSVMKKFFKYQIEEDYMREKVGVIFDKLKDMKSSRTTVKTAFENTLTFLSFVSRKTSKNEGESSLRASGSNQLSYAQQMNMLLPTVYGNSSFPSGDTQQQEQQQHQQQQHSTGYKHSNNHHQSLPVLHSMSSNSNINQQHTSMNSTTQKHNTRYSNNNGSSGAEDQQVDGHSNTSITTNATNKGNMNTVSFRVRGSTTTPSTNNNNNQSANINNTNSNNLNSSLRSSNGWLQHTAAGGVSGVEDVEGEEERLERELRKAKKKAKKEAKLREWTAAKEERVNQEMRLQEEEKKAMREAEAAKEEKRKEYARKAKEKITSYQAKVKNESEKIQEMLNLGIDPKSLNCF